MIPEKLENCPWCRKILPQAYYDMQACPCGWNHIDLAKRDREIREYAMKADIQLYEAAKSLMGYYGTRTFSGGLSKREAMLWQNLTNALKQFEDANTVVGP